MRCIETSALVAGEAAPFELSTAAAEDNERLYQLLANEKIALTFGWEGGGPIAVVSSSFEFDKETEVVTCSLSFGSSGSYTMWISSESCKVETTPISFAVGSGRVCANRCSVIGQGLSRAHVGRKAEFTIIARDRLGNRLHRGGLSFDVGVCTTSGASAKQKVKDCSDGAYVCEFVPSEKGE